MKSKTQNRLWNVAAVLVCVASLTAGWKAHGQNTAPSSGQTSPPPPGFATRADYLQSFKSDDEAHQAYLKGLIDKDEGLQVHFRLGNLKQQDFYGKVVDQFGQPVVGADVNGFLRSDMGIGLHDEKVEVFKTQTDANGLFQFTGVQGARFGQKVSKAGYEMKSSGYINQAGLMTSADDRAVFSMWKLRGAEPMFHKRFEAHVPYDGTGTTFNTKTGKKADDGDLRITLLRSPLKIRPGSDKYDWKVKVELLGGGLLQEKDAYPYWAPKDGYQPTFEAGLTADAVPWSRELRKDFYIKNAQGHYGHLFLDLFTDSTRPDTGCYVETWTNPSGSQNLEYNSLKAVH